jgi:hypothetical protein
MRQTAMLSDVFANKVADLQKTCFHIFSPCEKLHGQLIKKTKKQ